MAAQIDKRKQNFNTKDSIMTCKNHLTDNKFNATHRKYDYKYKTCQSVINGNKTYNSVLN